jgi:hypothetical protein
MLPTRKWIALGFSLAVPVFLAQSLLAQAVGPSPTTHHKSHKTAKPLVLPPLPSGPLRQLPMDQIPPTPAKVSFQDGLLTISAQNSNLGEILRDVRRLTGAAIEIPQGLGANERVVTHLGPGAPRDVLAGLLNGSSFNYVMLGSSSDPSAVSSLILTAKPSATGETQTAANVYENNAAPPNRFPPPQPFNPQIAIQRLGEPQPGNVQAAPTDVVDDSKDEEDNSDDNADDQAQPGQPGQPEGTGGVAQDQQQSADPNQPNSGPKTPEQILEMLRRQQQPPNGVINPPPQPQQQ